jgi:hypothetical protein
VAVIKDTLGPKLIAELGINKGGESRADCRQEGRHLIGRVSRVEAIGVEGADNTASRRLVASQSAFCLRELFTTSRWPGTMLSVSR